MKTQSDPVVSEAARSLIAVRVPLAHEVELFDGLLADHHYLGAGRAVGDYLRQVVEREGRTVALVVWGPACYALKDRDLWISWSTTQRVERLKLIVQNRRFLVLAAKGESPNLASQAMGAALRLRQGGGKAGDLRNLAPPRQQRHRDQGEHRADAIAGVGLARVRRLAENVQ